jgi:hypothetical protein
MKSKLELGIFIGGPKAVAIVYDMAHVEPVIAALCSITGDDPDDYTATDMDNPTIASPEEVAAIEAAIGNLNAEAPTGSDPFVWTDEMKNDLMDSLKTISELEND